MIGIPIAGIHRIYLIGEVVCRHGPRIAIYIGKCKTPFGATDDAIAAGIAADARVMLLAPCCHKELRPQIDKAAPKSPLHDILKYGTFAERHAEILTDTLRALFLERAGYKVKIAEFVAAEHTARNVMLIATRHPHPPRRETEERIAALKDFYGIRTYRLEKLLEPLLERD